MKKTMSILLAGAMMIGAMSITAFAADVTGKGEMNVTTTQTTPEFPDPGDTESPDYPEEGNPNPEIPTDENGNSLAKFWNTNLTYEGGDVAALKARAAEGQAQPLTSKNAMGQTKAGIVVANNTLKDEVWSVKVTMSDFFTENAQRAIPGFELKLSNGAVISPKGAPEDIKPSIDDKILTANIDPQLLMKAQADNFSRGYWAGSWDSSLKLTQVILPGNAKATMTWTTSFGSL